MAKFNFDVEREVKYSRKDGGKAVRIILLFCLVAAVTAAVIYFILPKNDPEKAPAVQPPAPAPAEPGENAPEKKDDPSAPAGGTEKNPVKPENDKEKTPDAPQTADTPAESDTKDKAEENGTAQKGDEPAVVSGGSAKYDPASSELLKITDAFRSSLQNGSWKKSRDTGVHTVVAGDSLERIARRNNTTLQFLKRANGITNADTIRIGQKIHFLKAEKWQITVSRKKAELLLERVLNGQAIPFALFPCRMKAGVPDDNLMILRRYSEPVYIDDLGRKFPAGTEGNPYGEGLLTLARPASPNARLRICIHGQGDAPAVEKSVNSGGIVLHNQDMELLYLLVPEKTPVKIVE